MVLYLTEEDNLFICFGYKSYKEGKGNFTGYKNSIATTVGYMDKSFITEDITPVLPTEYTAAIFNTLTELLGYVKANLADIESVVIIGHEPLSYYLKHGESFDGMKDKDIPDLDTVISLRNKIKNTEIEDTAIKVRDELLLLKKYAPREWVFEEGKYWDLKITKHIMLTGNKLIHFPNLSTYNSKNLYLCTNVKETDEIGKQIESINYNILLTDPIPEVDNLVSLLDTGLSQPIVIKIDMLFNKEVVRSLLYGELSFNRYNGAVEVLSPNGIILAILYSPPGLMMILRDDIRMVLNAYETGTRLSITDKIYSGNKILPELENKFTLDISTGDTNVRLHTAIDTYDRNKFKSIEKLNPNVELCYLARKKTITHYSCISTDNGISITYAPYNNVAFKK